MLVHLTGLKLLIFLTPLSQVLGLMESTTTSSPSSIFFPEIENEGMHTHFSGGAGAQHIQGFETDLKGCFKNMHAYILSLTI